MSLLGKIFGRKEALTTAMLAGELVSRQSSFFEFYRLLRVEHDKLRPVDLSNGALLELSLHNYLCHFAFVAIVLEDNLDDTRILDGGKAQGTDLFKFVNDVHEHGRTLARQQRNTDFAIALVPFDFEFKEFLSDFVFYYGSCFTELSTLRDGRPDAVEYAETMIAEMKMKTPNPLAKPMSLAYYQAHRLLFSPGSWKSKYNLEKPDIDAYSVILRTWQPWCSYFITFFKEFEEGAAKRTPAF